jgi:hypothetical protein
VYLNVGDVKSSRTESKIMGMITSGSYLAVSIMAASRQVRTGLSSWFCQLQRMLLIASSHDELACIILIMLDLSSSSLLEQGHANTKPRLEHKQIVREVLVIDHYLLAYPAGLATSRRLP